MRIAENYAGTIKNNIKLFGVANRAVANLAGNTIRNES